MALHLNYDGKQENGIIFNNTYTQGAMYNGLVLKPTLSFEFDSMQYSEVFEGLNYVELNNVKKVMTPEQETEVIALATAWVQELGAEGNPTLVQAQVTQTNLVLSNFEADVKNISTATSHEMSSWRKQEEQARAYLLDNTTLTPIIDALLAARNLGETKLDFINLIITHADAYETAYGTLLGKFQALQKSIETVLTVSEIQLIVW